MRITHYLAVALTVIVGTTSTPLLQAQDADLPELTVSKTSQVGFGGSLGTVMNLVGAGDPTSETTMLSAESLTMRTDRDDTSTVIRYSDLQVTSIDHDDRSYFTYNLAEMMRAAPIGGGSAGGTEPRDDSEADVEYDIRFSIETPGERKEVANEMVDRVVMRVSAVPVSAKDQDVDELPTYELVSELWVSEDFVGNQAMRRISEAAAEQIRQTPFGGMDPDTLRQVFTQNENFRSAFEEKEVELHRLGAMPFEQTMAFASVPAGAEFDLDAALSGPLAEGVSAGAIARQGASQAVRGALGRVGGLFGRGRDDDDATRDEPPAGQSVILRVHEMITEVTLGALPPGWSIPPDEYEEKESPYAALGGR